MTPSNLKTKTEFHSKHLSYLSTKLDCVIYQEMTIFIFMAARTSNLECNTMAQFLISDI
jgi:hypothetical protein